MSKCKNVDPLDQIVHETAENGTYHSENTYCNSEQKSFGQYMKSFGKSFFVKTVVPAFIFVSLVQVFIVIKMVISMN